MQKLNMQFTQDDIMQYTDFNTIEDKLEEVMQELRDLGYAKSSNLLNEEYYSNASLYNVNVYRGTLTDIVGDRTLYVKAKLKEGKTGISGLYLLIGTHQNPNISGSTTAWFVNNGVILNQNKTFTNNNPLYLSWYPSTVTVSEVFDTYNLSVSENDVPYEPYKDISYTKKVWTNKDYLLYTYLNNIEDGLKNIGKVYFKPYGWQETKTWTPRMSFSYRDVNRWINNLNLIIDRLNTESNTLFPSDTLYPSETLLPH